MRACAPGVNARLARDPSVSPRVPWGGAGHCREDTTIAAMEAAAEANLAERVELRSALAQYRTQVRAAA